MWVRTFLERFDAKLPKFAGASLLSAVQVQVGFPRGIYLKSGVNSFLWETQLYLFLCLLWRPYLGATGGSANVDQFCVYLVSWFFISAPHAGSSRRSYITSMGNCLLKHVDKCTLMSFKTNWLTMRWWEQLEWLVCERPAARGLGGGGCGDNRKHKCSCWKPVTA